eukprot:scaffold7798_cov126-Isochrysis_galbana.AAC.6
MPRRCYPAPSPPDPPWAVHHLGDAVNIEAAADIIDKAEELVRLLDANHIHEASGVLQVGARLAVHLDQPLHQNVFAFLARQRILQLVAQQDDERHAFAQLVRAGRRPRGPDTTELVKHPMLGGIEPLQVPLRAARHAGSVAMSATSRVPRLLCHGRPKKYTRTKQGPVTGAEGPRVSGARMASCAWQRAAGLAPAGSLKPQPKKAAPAQASPRLVCPTGRTDGVRWQRQRACLRVRCADPA